MTPEAVFVSVLTKLATSASTSALKALHGSLAKTPLFKSAIASVEKDFPNIIVEHSLRIWCESGEFENLLISLKDGKRLLVDSEVVESYINDGGFYSAENTETDAKAVLASFFKHLEILNYSSSDGTATLAKRQEILHEETRNDLKEAIVPVQNQLVEVNSSLNDLKLITASLGDKSITPHEAEEKILHARIDEANKLIKLGKCSTALNLLTQLRADSDAKNPSKSVLYRLSTNIGYCHHVLNDVQKAKDEFLLAYKLEPSNPKAIANYAAVLLQTGKAEEALTLIKGSGKVQKGESVLAANYITVLLSLDKKSDYETLLVEQSWILDDADCCFAIGNGMFESGKYQEAETFLRKANLLTNSIEPRTLTLLAHCLIRPTQQSLQDQPILASQFTSDFKAILAEANAFLNHAVELLTNTDDSLILNNALILRADIRRMLGDDIGAIADCDLVLTKTPKEDVANQLKGICSLHLRKHDEAVVCFENISSASLNEKIIVPYAAAYYLAGKHEKVIELVAPLQVNGIQTKPQIKAIDFLISSYLETANDSRAEEIVSKLKEHWTNDSDALVVIAHYYQKIGKSNEAENAFLEGLSYASDLERPTIALDLAEFYYAQNNFSKAANHYKAVLENTSENSGFNHRYLACLYNSGSLKEALELAKRIRNEGEPLQFVSQIEANILIEFGDLATALVLLEKLSIHFPSIPTYKIEAAQCAYRLVKHDVAKQILRGIKYDEIKDRGDILIRVAQLRSLLEMEDVLKCAYQARRAAPSSPEIHAAYMTVIVNREGNDLPPPSCDVCEMDCSIVLKTPDGIVTYTLLDEPDIHTERGELSAKDARCMGLIGKKKGEVFTLKTNVWQDYVVEVLEIKSKYVSAFQETLSKFSTTFPTSNLIQPLRGEYEDFREGFFRQLDIDQLHTQKVVAVYEKMQITLEYFAELCGKSLINTWGILIGGNYTKLISHSGTVEEMSRDLHEAVNAESVVLELTSVLTLSALGLLNRLPKRYKQIYCTQAVLDELNQYIIENTNGKGGLTIGKIGDSYVRDEITPENIQKRKVYFENIRDFLIKETIIAPIMLETDEREFKWTEMKKVLGSISTASVLAAKEHKALLLSEDAMLRALARNEWKISGAWTQTILLEFNQKNIITNDEYCDAVVKLVLMNFRFVSINAEVIMWLYSKKGFQQSQETKRLFDFFKGPDCSIESAVGVLSEAVKKTWLEPLLYENKLAVLDDALAALVHGRPLEQAVELFLLVLKERFHLIQGAYLAIEKYTKIWRKRQMSKSGLAN